MSNTNTDPNSNLGLKFNAGFTVGATFGLTPPPTGSYGLELNDGTATHGVDQLVRLIVMRVSGNTVVELVQRDLTANPQTNIILAEQPLTAGQLANNSQIEFQLSHVANSTAITGAFALGNGGIFGPLTTFGPTATIFTNGVNWTRADIGAFTDPGVGLNIGAEQIGAGQSPREGQTLTASATTNDSDATLHYQWQSSANGGQTWNPIAGAADSASYTVQESDENHNIQVVVSTTDPDNSQTASVTSVKTGPVVDNSSLSLSVSVVGNLPVQQGQTLVATAVPSDADDASATVTYEWQSSSDNGQSWTNVPATAAGNFANGVPSSFYQLSEGDEGKVFRATASFTDDTGQVVSTTSAQTVPVADVTPEITIPFSYAVDNLSIVKNGTQIYSNNFAVAPPASPTILANGTPTPIVFITQGSTWSESGGKAVASSTGVALNPNVPPGPPGSPCSTFDIAVLNTNTDPASTMGLKQGADFTVSSTFDLVTPPTGSYGMELTDGTSTHPIDQLERLLVQRVSGNAVVELIQANLDNQNTQTVLASYTLTAADLAGNNQIEFQFAHAANATAVTGTFELIDNGTVTSTTTFSPAASIFTNGVDWTRADVGAFTNTGVGLNVVAGVSPREGQTLIASASTNDSDATLHYQWQKSNDNFASFTVIGTDSASYVLQEPDEGFSIRVVASTTDPDNSQTTSVTSATTGPVLDALPMVTTPIITGMAQQGQTLTASASSGESDDPVNYTWYSSADGYTKAIALGATYLVKEIDEGFTLEVKATAANDGGLTATATSVATSAVVDAAPTVTTPVIAGMAQEGQTLTASASSGQPDNLVSYQWMEDNGPGGTYQNIAGATGATYVLQESDEGFNIEVKATATNDNGATVTATRAATAAVLPPPNTNLLRNHRFETGNFS